jgi:hypothetical protein
MAQTQVKRTKEQAAHATERVEKSSTAARKRAVDRTAELSDEVLKSVGAGQRAAIEAVRKFVDTVDEVLPAMGDRPSRRETVIDGALEMADKLVTTQYDFLRSVVRSVDRSLGKAGAAKN